MENTFFGNGWRTEHPYTLDTLEHRGSEGVASSARSQHLDLDLQSNSTAKKSITDTLAQSMDKVNNWFHNRKSKKKPGGANDALDAPSAASHGPQWHDNYLPDNPSFNEPLFIESSFYDLDFNFDEPPPPDFRRGSDGFDASHHIIDMNPAHTPVKPNFQHAVGMLRDEDGMHESDLGHYAFSNAVMHHGVDDHDPARFAAHGKPFDRSDAMRAPMAWPLPDIDANNSTTSRSSITHSAGDNSSSDLRRLESNAIGQAVSVQGSSTGHSLSQVPTPPGSSDQTHMQGNWAPFALRQDADRVATQHHMYQQQQQFVPYLGQNYELDHMLTTTHQYAAISSPPQTILPSQPPPQSLHTPLKPGTPAETINERLTPSNQVERHLTPNAAPANDTTTPDTNMSASPPSSSEMKQPRAISGLAARRQKRPAALGSAAMRSASHATGGPGSPKVPATAPIQGLRRIQSSTGVLSGRVQKSGVSSAPRSPLNFSFADAATSPKFPKSMSNTSLAAQINSDDDFNMNKPLTPSSPQYLNAQMNILQSGNEKTAYPMGIQWAEALSTKGVISPSTNCPPTALKEGTVVSPPTTPMDHRQFAQMRLRTPSNAHLVLQHPPVPQMPQSAPAFQQTFHIPTYNPYAQHPPMPAMPGPFPGPHHMYASPPMQPQYAVYQQAPPEMGRRPSIPGNAPVHMAFMQHPNLSAPSIPNSDAMHGQPRMHYQPMPPQQMSHMHPGHPLAGPESNYYMQPPPQPQYTMSPPSAVTPERQIENTSVAELQIHEYSPLEPVDSFKLPPKSMTPSGPKQYSFQNTGPEHYGREA